MSTAQATGSDVDVRIERALASADHATASSEVIRGYGPAILGYLIAILREPADARDAFSLFSEDVWKGIETYRGEGSIRGWAYKVAYRAAMRIAADKFRQRGRPLETEEHSRLADEVWSRTPIHQQTAVKDRVRQLREQLTQDEQTLLILRIDRDLGWDEVARVLDINEATARKRFERVKDKLRELARGLKADG